MEQQKYRQHQNQQQQQQQQQVDDGVIVNDDTWREEEEGESAQPSPQRHQLEGIVEAPCYYPTAEQFEEPLKYITSIRPEAESYGVCRICPPLGWKPPFAHRPDKLRFATKEQDLSELAGTQRLTRKFTENLRKFLFLIGQPMESSFSGKVCLKDDGDGPLDMFRLFKSVQSRGGHERVTQEQGWAELAAELGFPRMGNDLHEAYLRYLSDFEAANSGRGIEGGYSPVVYQEKASVEADLRVGTTLWHFMEEDHGPGRCYAGTVKAIRPNAQCVVEYDKVERDIPGGCSSRRGLAGERGLNARLAGYGEWANALHPSEDVEAFRVTLPRSQLSTLVLNGRSPAAAKLAAHGVVCEVCSIASASNATLAVCASCDSAYHLRCVEPTLSRVPLHDWFCGDCAKDGNSAEALAQGIWAMTVSSSSSPSISSSSAKTGANGRTKKHAEAGSSGKKSDSDEDPKTHHAETMVKEEGNDGRKGESKRPNASSDICPESRGNSEDPGPGRGGRGQDGGNECGTTSASRMRGVSSMKGRALKYGFGNGGQFTLKEFALMADGWRSSYLARRGLGDDATEEEMEAEFWKLVGPNPPEDDVKVLYGSDLDTGAVGSGFPWSRGAGAAADGQAGGEQLHPSKRKRGRFDSNNEEVNGYEEYSYEDDAWNLNCLPTADGSLLQFLGTQIQGVMVPWLYVGMAFSAFCWHNEDHYLYSINYLHAGSPKRWYGVPGAMAGKFEAAVQKMFPELFEAHPDLLMQLVTMAHPSELAKRGVTVASTTQREGEFVLTFPQAYHAGFNMGTNCAEAVNFAPPDWLPWGNAAQERYRLHKRKPVFSHEGLVLSLVDLLTKQSREGVHTSGDLYKFLRDEVEALAVAQEEEMAVARHLGCTRFESVEKLAERLRGSTINTTVNPVQLANGNLPTSSVTLASMEGSRRRSVDSCFVNHGYQGVSSNGDDGVLAGIESASPVQGPRCTVCGQYCFLAVAVCDTCDAVAMSGRRGSRSGSGSLRRFVCGRHLKELCACPCSEYTFYARKDAAALRAAGSGLSSLQEHLDVWTDEARGIIASVNGGAEADTIAAAAAAAAAREEEGRTDGDGDDKVVGVVEEKEEDAHDGREVLPSTTSNTKSVAAPKTERNDTLAAAAVAASMAGDKISKSQIPRRHHASTIPPTLGKPGLQSSMLPPRWHERPTLGYLKDLIKVGGELGGSEVLLVELAALVDGCARWTKAVGALRLDGSLNPLAELAGAAVAAEKGSGTAGGREGRGRSALEKKEKNREQASFHKAAALLRREGGLSARPVELTEKLFCLILRACDLRKQVRLMLGLAQDEELVHTTGLCLELQEAAKAAEPPALKSSCLITDAAGSEAGTINAACAGGTQTFVAASAAAESCDALAEGGDDSLPTSCAPENNRGGGGMISSAGGDSSLHSSSPSGSSGGGTAQPTSPSRCSTSTDQQHPTETAPAAAGGLTNSVGGGGSAGGVTNNPTSGVSTGPTGRTRTRTNVSLPTGTLAAERGVWRGQPWRLWPVHQGSAAALVEPCLSSPISVPELAPLRQGLAGLARRDNRAQMKVKSATLKLPADQQQNSGGFPAPSNKRASSNVSSSVRGVGHGSGNGGGGAVKARRVYEKYEGVGKKGGGGGGGTEEAQQGKKTRALGYSPSGSPRAGVAAGGRVLLGAAHKRRRQDAVA